MKFFKKMKLKHKHVFLHIGLMKTGTTAIQHFILKNDSLLKQYGYRFSDVNRNAMNYLAFSLLDDMPPYVYHKLEDTRDLLYSKLREEILNSEENKIIISSEAFSLICTDRFLGHTGIKRFLEYFEGDPIKFTIIGFIRRQDEFLDSQYNQHIKLHDFYSLYCGEIDEFLNDHAYLLDFKKILSSYEAAFGFKNIIIRAYNNRNIINEFLSTIDIPVPQNYNRIARSNPRLSLQALEFMRIANRFGVDKATPRRINELVDVIEKNIENPIIGSSLHADQAKLIMQKNRSINEELSAKYLNGDTSWFDNEDSYIYRTNSSSVSLTKQEAVKIATEIWNRQIS